ncbi:aquaporin-like protein [Artomyces pyxidatus]|uniref:Aquaporin-like protein n=1 Tax=Artomyces pyxidatus TaxID=48021 RepID=A0ACB8TCG4_9AGAM|nr:aquaporin-like protein [Artomyces pyxidatus]
MVYAPDPHPLHLADLKTRPLFLQRWEKLKHRQAHWAIQCTSEAIGLFIVCIASTGSTAGFVLGGINGTTGFGSLFTVGLAFAIGIALSMIVCTATSGGHLNPAITAYWVVFKGMPVTKGARYILAQIFGAYIACLIVYIQWRTPITQTEAAMKVAGTYDSTMFTPGGPAGIFANYAPPGAHLGLTFINEFVVDFFAGLVIFAVVDPTNFLVPPSAMPWVIGITYAAAAWSYAPLGLAANSARDIGGRLAAMTIWGAKASGGSYAAIAGITSIPAMLIAACVYELIFIDSSRVITPAQADFLAGRRAHVEHCEMRLSQDTIAADDEEKSGEEKRSRPRVFQDRSCGHNHGEKGTNAAVFQDRSCGHHHGH